MRVWADIYSADGANRLGDGPITSIKSASVTRALDGPGKVSITVPGTDDRVITLLQNKRRIRIFVDYLGAVRELGRGVLDDLRVADASNGISFTASGPDELSLLKNKNTGLARLYSNQSAATVLSALATLAGWSSSGTAATLVSVRYDGESVLKAIQALCSQQGIHFRAGTDPNTIEIGTFGDDCGIRAFHIETAERDLYLNDKVAIIDAFSLSQDSKDVCNWLLPIGAGEGEAALTLKKSTRSIAGGYPYDIQTTTGPDGRTLYYLSDAASITAYGQIEKIGTFKNIAPLSNSDNDVIRAANGLYDAAVAWLQRNKDKLDVYDLTIKKVGLSIEPGDKIHVRYKGVVNRDGVPYTYRDVNSDFWILEATEDIGLGGLTTRLKVASIDRYERDAAQVIVGALDALEIKNLKVQPYPTKSGYVYDREISAGTTYTAKIPVRITDATLSLERCNVRIKTSAFRATASAASSGGGATSNGGGDHRHRMFVRVSGTGNGYAAQSYKAKDSGGSEQFLDIPVNSGQDLYTYDASGDHTHTTPNHTHSLTYGISDDSQTPGSISVFVDGTNRTTALGGPFLVGGGAGTIDLDAGLITGYLNNAAGGLRQEHIIELRCSTGQGRVEVQVELFETIQSIAV